MNCIPNNKQIILFDGVCNLCNDSIIKIIRFDRKNKFVFASLQSNIGKKILTELQIDTNKVDSIILYSPKEAYYTKSSAILHIATEFGSSWKLLKLFFIIPKPIRDFFYDIIAKNRYKWFGKKESCMIPSEELRNKFLA